MRTKKAVYDTLGRIMELGGFNAEQEADFASLRDDIEERDRLIRTAYDEWDEDADEVEPVKTVAAVPDPDAELQAKYDDLVSRYKSAFFAGHVREDEDIAVDVSEGVKDISTEIRVNDLFKEVE